MATATKPVQNLFDELTPEQQFLLPFIDGITVLEGRKGSGKSTASVALLYLLKEHFNMPVVCDFPLKEETFGEYTHMDINSFVKDLRIVSEATKGDSADVAERAVDKLMGGRRSILDGSAILLDEAYKYLDCRTPADKVVRLFGYWISQIRHFRASLIIVVPDVSMMDKRIHRQIDRIGRVYTDHESGEVVALFNDIMAGERKRLVFDAEKYWTMFDSWVLTPFRMQHMNVGRQD